jgi:hypothetical protein
LAWPLTTAIGPDHHPNASIGEKFRECHLTLTGLPIGGTHGRRKLVELICPLQEREVLRLYRQSRPQKRTEGVNLGNPFVIGKDGTREEVMISTGLWLLTNSDLLKKLPELRESAVADVPTRRSS